MRPSTWRLDDLRNVILNLGYVGENLHTRVIIDCKKMFDQYPNASVSMTVTPPEGEPYPGLIERDGDLVIWNVRDCDLVAEGDGEIQLVFTQEPHIARSYNARTHVCRSQVPTGDVPSGLDDFVTRADQLLDEVKDTFPAGGTTGQVLAKKSDADYDTEWVDQGAGGTSDYDELENRPQIGGVTLTGNKTLHDLGAASEAAVEAKYTKPETGIPASDLAAGVIPDPEDLIDDNAGSGDTDKVWSADKSHALLTEITNSEEKIASIEEIIICDGFASISLNPELGYYQKGGGGFVSDEYRRCAVVSPVSEGEVYKITTHTGTTNIAGIIYENSQNEVISYDLEGTGTQQDHIDYLFTIPENCTKLIVQSSNTTTPTLDKAVKYYNAIEYVTEQKIHVGSDIMGSAYATDGWTESDGTWTHTSGNTNVLVIDTSAVVGENYLLELDSVTSEETVRIGLGDTAYRLLIYTDKQHKQIPLKAYGNCKLYIEPISSSYNGSISNIVLRKIQGAGTEIILTKNNSVFAGNHTENYGFYNTILGVDSMLKTPGSTRCVAIGANALRDLQGGHRNIGIGTFAISQMIGGEMNIGIGADSMLAVLKATGCVAIGKSALYNGTENTFDTVIGHFAGQGSANMAGTEMCTLVGAFAGTQNKGNYNTFIGANAGYNVVTGKRNTLIGANINGQSSGDDNTCVGRMSGYPSGASHCIAVGVGAVCTKTKQMMLGSSNVEEVVLCGNKKINFNQDGTVTWETLT